MSYTANTDQPSKAIGQYHSLKVGQGAQGETEYKAAQAQAFVEGAADRISEKKDAVVGALTGDRQQEIEGNVRHDMGQAQQDMNKPQA